MPEKIWSFDLGAGPILAAAIHDGHELRKEVLRHIALGGPERLREEDPFTGRWAQIAPSRVVGLRSRFEVDLNRPREKAVYRTPEDAWGLEVWKGGLPEEVARRSLEAYDAFYSEVEKVFGGLAKDHGRFLVLDFHTYCHRRDGPDAPPAETSGNPQVNLGTGTMTDRKRWAPLIDRFIRELHSFDFPGGHLDVRENVKFRGGAFAAWTHRTFPDSACVLSIEFKKFFMDEWTGEPDESLLNAITRALESTIPGALEELAGL